jgi:AcrR family transcriptional regulator
MATSDRIERERQAKRALILEAARELFLERGYEAVTLRSVAERIEHSTTAVYVHFKDKRDLVEQMVNEDFTKFDAALLAAAEVQPALVRLERLGEAYIDFALRLPRHYQLLFLTPRPEAIVIDSPAEASPAPADQAAQGASGFDLLLSTVQACIDEGAFHAVHRDALGIAQAVWAAVHGLVSLLIIMGKESHFQWRAPEVLHQLLVGSMVRGLQQPPKRAAARRAVSRTPKSGAAGASSATSASTSTARGSGRGKRRGR